LSGVRKRRKGENLASSQDVLRYLARVFVNFLVEFGEDFFEKLKHDTALFILELVRLWGNQ
jgi:hypothetical protein